MKKVVRIIFAILIVFTLSISAHTQDTKSPKDAAGDAYEKGVQAFLSKNYTESAQWFSIAYKIIPSPAALIQTIRAYNKAGQTNKAAQLSLELVAKYSDAMVKGNPIKISSSTEVRTPCVIIEKTDSPVVDDLLDIVHLIIQVSSQQTKRMCSKDKENSAKCRNYLKAWSELVTAHEAAIKAFGTKNVAQGAKAIKKIKAILSQFKMYLDVSELPINPY